MEVKWKTRACLPQLSPPSDLTNETTVQGRGHSLPRPGARKESRTSSSRPDAPGPWKPAAPLAPAVAVNIDPARSALPNTAGPRRSLTPALAALGRGKGLQHVAPARHSWHLLQLAQVTRLPCERKRHRSSLTHRSLERINGEYRGATVSLRPSASKLPDPHH